MSDLVYCSDEDENAEDDLWEGIVEEDGRVAETEDPTSQTEEISQYEQVVETIEQAVEAPVSNKDRISAFIVNNNLTPKDKIRWRKNVTFLTPPIRWYVEQPENAVSLDSPITFFENYFKKCIYSRMAEYTNLYAVQQQARFVPTNADEMKVFVGIHIVMGNLHYPRVRNYWESKLQIPLISNNMNVNRFFKLRQNLHFVDAQMRPETNDRFWKIRPLYDILRKRCLELPIEENLCIDEQMVPFKGNLNVKQYIRGKPSPWGVKIFALCGSSGIMYDFLIYQGSTTEYKRDYVDVFGLGAGVVLHLAERINKQNCKLFFDNYFSNYNLLQYLRNKYIWASCTARVDRFRKPPFSNDKDLRKKGRGSSEEIISEDGEVILTKWLDNNTVVMASNYTATGIQDTCRRWDKTEKKYILIQRPQVIREYNTNMGGVDKMDFLITIYRTFIRSKKWTLRMFTHAIDIALVNGWLEYKKRANQIGVPKKNIMDLLRFRSYVAEGLILVQKEHSRKRGRPSSVPEMSSPSTSREATPTSSRNRSEMLPIVEVRHDGMHHIPEIDEKDFASRCKFPGCSGRSRTFCLKCKVHLCLSKKKNCFLKFHTK